MDLGAVRIPETWLTSNASDQKIVGHVTSAGYSFDHTARTDKTWASR